MLNDHRELLKILKANPADKELIYRGKTPLITAIKCDSFECFRALLDYDAEIETKTRRNETALTIAVGLKSLPYIKSLVQQNANIYHLGECNLSPTQMAIRYDNCEILEIINDQHHNLVRPKWYDDLSALSYAINRNARRCIDYIISLVPSLQMYIVRREICPIVAAIHQHDEYTFRQLSQLPDFNTVLNIPVSNLTTYLHETAAQKLPRMTEILLKNGAKVNAFDIFNHTPLHNARDAHTVRLLLKAGADTDCGVISPLKEARYTRRNAVFQYLRLYEKKQMEQRKKDSPAPSRFNTCACSQTSLHPVGPNNSPPMSPSVPIHPPYSPQCSISPISPFSDLPDFGDIPGIETLMNLPDLNIEIHAAQVDKGVLPSASSNPE
jgi:ankyrin repeat protein